MQPIHSTLDVIRSVVPILSGRRILDIGCGAGGLVRQLLAEGANVTGIDPGIEAIRDARRNLPGAAFKTASAEVLPFGNETFDLAVMVNALHHVPEPLMRQALREGLRVTRQESFFIVIEPLASGSFFEALRLIEDETGVRNAAQAAIRDAVAAGDVKLVRTVSYARQESFADADEFLERIVSVDPARRDAAERNRERLAETLKTVAVRREARFILDQPAKADFLAR